MTLVFVTGTGTEVGKTWVTAAATRALRERGVEVHCRKPVQSFDPRSNEPTDAAVLADASGEPNETVCPAHRGLPIAMAPPMAAAALDLPTFTIADLVAETTVPDAGVTFVEGAGGLRSPIAGDGDSFSLIEALQPHTVVLVADAGLGTINLVRLCCAALAPRNPVVFLNRFDASDQLHERNRTWLRTVDDVHVVTTVDDLAAHLVHP